MSQSYDGPDDPTGLDQADEMTIGAENDGVIEGSDSLEDGPTSDPLDTGILPTDRYYGADRFGTTEEEEEEGESLDQLLAEEEPEPDPYAEDEDDDEEDLTGDEADPRSGRLVEEDEGAHPDEEPDLFAYDVGIDGGAAGAEEAAVHVLADDEDG
jgi:Family of unknown function (DUF5709)